MTLTEMAKNLKSMPNQLQTARNKITAAGLDDVRPDLQKRAIALALKMHEVETEMAELVADAQKPSQADQARRGPTVIYADETTVDGRVIHAAETTVDFSQPSKIPWRP